MIQTKIFSTHLGNAKLENDINNWLKEKYEDPTLRVIDIKICSSTTGDFNLNLTALITYSFETEREKEAKYRAGATMLGMLKGEADE